MWKCIRYDCSWETPNKVRRLICEKNTQKARIGRTWVRMKSWHIYIPWCISHQTTNPHEEFCCKSFFSNFLIMSYSMTLWYPNLKFYVSIIVLISKSYKYSYYTVLMEILLMPVSKVYEDSSSNLWSCSDIAAAWGLHSWLEMCWWHSHLPCHVLGFRCQCCIACKVFFVLSASYMYGHV